MLVAVEVVAGKGKTYEWIGEPKKAQGQDLAPDLVKRAFFSIEITSFLDPIFLNFWVVRGKGKE